MAKVPGLPNVAAEGLPPPSDTMLMMAAAVMHEQGRLFPSEKEPDPDDPAEAKEVE